MSDSLLCEETRARLADTSLGRELLAIFQHENITTLFQPIVNLKKRSIYAFECLTRGPENTPLYSPINLFGLADDMGCLLQMDVLARNVAIRNFVSASSFHQNQAKLFINVTVSSLLDKNHRSGRTLQLLAQSQLDLSQVVIEITELQPIEDCDIFLKALNHYRSMGFKVAIDDLGSGYNGLKLWSAVKPDYVKIDKHFISNIDSQADKYRFMETIVILAKGLGTKIIAEGVETEQELYILEKLGVDLVQGFLLKRPSALPALSLSFKWPDRRQVTVTDNETVKVVNKHYKWVNPNETVFEVAEYLLNNPDVVFVPVVDKGIPTGMVWRHALMNVLATQYGRNLHSRKAIKKFMDEPLVYNIKTPLVDVSNDITEMGAQEKSAFIITENNKYVGCGSFMDLLKVMTDLKVRSAKYANPLSGLPGNVPIQNKIQQYLDSNMPFSVIYVDVDHFKAYNDCYSFEQGDQVIAAIANVLESVMAGKEGFVGHIGGDDFVIVTEEDYETVSNRVLSDFRLVSKSFYTEEDRERGGIQSFSRDGKPYFFPMMTLSVGVLLVYPDIFVHTQKLSSVATKAKKGAKSAGGNQFFVIDSRDYIDA
jgi:diguanylate cyclase (GGDEF)-like protein